MQAAQAAAIPVAPANGPFVVDGVSLNPAGDGYGWLIEAGQARVAVVPPETSWDSLPSDVVGAIFTSGGPPEWHGPGHGFSVVQVAANSREGLPVRAILQALSGAPLFRTDHVGTVEMLESEAGFRSVN